jgi:hypothetical protein
MKREGRVFLERVLFGQYVMTAALLPPFAKLSWRKAQAFRCADVRFGARPILNFQ